MELLEVCMVMAMESGCDDERPYSMDPLVVDDEVVVVGGESGLDMLRPC